MVNCTIWSLNSSLTISWLHGCRPIPHFLEPQLLVCKIKVKIIVALSSEQRYENHVGQHMKNS